MAHSGSRSPRAAEQGVGADEAWSTSDLRSLQCSPPISRGTRSGGLADIDSFWTLIDDCRGETDDCETLADLVVKRLSALPRTEVAAFTRLFDELLDRAYRWDPWGAAYIINGGCSDDGFEYSRCWLIAQGRHEFERALADPESLVDVAEPDVECEDLLYAGGRAWEAVTGESKSPERHAPYPSEPAG
jgi:hypothetical protein